MHCLKFGRVTQQLFYTAIVLVLLSPAVLFSQDQIPASDIQSPAKGIEQPNTQVGPVLVAASSLNIGTELKQENVKVENWPTSIIPPEAITTLEEIKDMVTLNPMSQGLPIVKSSIRHKNYNSNPGIPPLMKVVAVRVAADDTIGPPLNPGDRVDVIGVFKRRDRSTNLATTNSRTFLKGVQMYSVGNIDAITKSRTSPASSIVGLLVTEKQSEALVFVQDNGSIKLALRGDDLENDGEVVPLEEIREILSEEEVTKFKEIKNLRALVNDQEQVLQQFQKRLERLERVERLEQVKPSK